MSRPNRLAGYTLVELLVVLVIFGVILLLSSGMSQRARDTFIAQQQIKSYVQSTRIVRRKSMLITRNSSDKEWVHGIGIRFDKLGSQWRMTQFKALREVAGNQFFYISYPKINPCLEVEWRMKETGTQACVQDNLEMKLRRIEGTVSQFLPTSMQIEATVKSNTTTVATNCASAITIIYESINGEMHVYCDTGTSETAITGDLDVTLKIKYTESADYYRYRLNLKSNGEINAVNL
ncbi:prepilin-type N-terminal cleavage/methylation domain-containing protein [bacterium]|nr:prepilin-type N-terminal cleavage/methylation domain-containing protein [bacterium]